VWLKAFDDSADSSQRLTIQIRWSPTGERPAEIAQTNAIRARIQLLSKDATIVEQHAEAFAGGQGDFIVASAGARTTLHFLRVLPNKTEVGLSTTGESHAMESAREAVMDIARSVELRESALAPIDAR
jgi:hypothetical protein